MELHEGENARTREREIVGDGVHLTKINYYVLHIQFIIITTTTQYFMNKRQKVRTIWYFVLRRRRFLK